MNEEWRDVIGYEGLYQVSNFGNVRGKRGNLSTADMLGYKRVVLYKDKKKKSLLVHRLVAHAFIGDNNGLHVNHIDMVRHNNNVENLEYVTHRENLTHGKVGSNLVGCYFDRKHNRWQARIFINGKSIYLGTFATEKEAHEQYMCELKKHGLENKYAEIT